MDATPPETVVGIDFSGAQDAGRHIWLAELDVSGDGAVLERCLPAEELDFGGPSLSDALYGLSTEVRTRGDAAFGVDVPFGLPAKLADADSWASFVAAFPDRFGDPEGFREACRDRDGGTELRRVTDDEAGTPWSPYNHRIYRQTYHAVNSLLAPLVKADRVRVLPMQEPSEGRAWVLEVCPAATLASWDLHDAYKEKADAARARREEILDAVCDRRGIAVEGDLRDRLVDDARADGIDALVAADATARAVRKGPHETDPASPYAVEGYVYV